MRNPRHVRISFTIPHRLIEGRHGGVEVLCHQVIKSPEAITLKLDRERLVCVTVSLIPWNIRSITNRYPLRDRSITTEDFRDSTLLVICNHTVDTGIVIQFVFRDEVQVRHQFPFKDGCAID